MADRPIAVRVDRRFRSPPERVYEAWLDPATAGEWLFATPAGEMVQVEIDPRVGGHFHLVERRDGENAAHHGLYAEMDPPRRLAFDVSVGDTPATRVTVDVAPAGEGAELTLVHRIAPDWAAYAERTAQGWTRILEALARTLGETDPAS